MFAKLLLRLFQLFKINKIFENTLSLRVAGNGTKKQSQRLLYLPSSTDRSPVFSQAFVNFSQFNFGF